MSHFGRGLYLLLRRVENASFVGSIVDMGGTPLKGVLPVWEPKRVSNPDRGWEAGKKLYFSSLFSPGSVNEGILDGSVRKKGGTRRKTKIRWEKTEI